MIQEKVLRVDQDETTYARAIIINQDTWSDYVFAEDYELKPLSEVEAFIDANNHLPDVPSETEIFENGVNLGQMDETLLRKIEELTLYVIELKKESDSQQQLIEKSTTINRSFAE